MKETKLTTNKIQDDRKLINEKYINEVLVALWQLVERCKDGLFDWDEIEHLICDIEEHYLDPLNEISEKLLKEEIKIEVAEIENRRKIKNGK